LPRDRDPSHLPIHPTDRFSRITTAITDALPSRVK
jgi:hypothetical protein